jgi:hypothetical protein
MPPMSHSTHIETLVRELTELKDRAAYHRLIGDRLAERVVELQAKIAAIEATSSDVRAPGAEAPAMR